MWIFSFCSLLLLLSYLLMTTIWQHRTSYIVTSPVHVVVNELDLVIQGMNLSEPRVTLNYSTFNGKPKKVESIRREGGDMWKDSAIALVHSRPPVTTSSLITGPAKITPQIERAAHRGEQKRLLDFNEFFRFIQCPEAAVAQADVITWGYREIHAD